MVAPIFDHPSLRLNPIEEEPLEARFLEIIGAIPQIPVCTRGTPWPMISVGG
jgi:hypothetical protein